MMLPYVRYAAALKCPSSLAGRAPTENGGGPTLGGGLALANEAPEIMRIEAADGGRGEGGGGILMFDAGG